MNVMEHAKQQVAAIVQAAYDKAVQVGALPQAETPAIAVETPKDAANGDWACTAPMQWAKPLRMAPSLAVLITAIGVSYFLQNMALLIWGSSQKSFTSVVGGSPIQLFGGQLTIAPVTIVTIVTCVVIMVVLTLFTNRSKAGTAMRAVSEDKGAAQLMGINVNTTISLTFAIGSGLAAIAGVLLCSAYPTLMPTTGSMPGIKAFTAAVFGGIGSIPGAFIGGILLGVIEIFAGAYISTQLSNAIVFAVLIIVLLVKPDGLLGKHISEKV